MKRYNLAELRLPPANVNMNWDEFLPSTFEEWIQSPEFWLLIVYQHSGVAYQNMDLFTYEPGQAILYPPHCRGAHAKVGPGQPCYRILIELKGGGDRRALPAHMTLDESWLRWIENAYEALGTTNSLARSLLWHLLWAISLPESAYRGRPELYAAEEWIRANLEKPFSVAELAKAVDLSERTLARLFKAEYGVGPGQFVRDRRIREAARLLTGTNLPLKEIGKRIGAGTSQAFYCLFRDAVGMSPSELRERGGLHR